MEVGNNLIFLDTSYNKTRGKISQGIIEKIGRKFFYVRVGHDLMKVEIKKDFPIAVQEYGGILFNSQELFNDYLKHKKNLKLFEIAFRRLDLLTPDQVRRILAIIEE